MDLTGIFSPPDIRLATKIGETRGAGASPARGQRRDTAGEDHADDLLDLSITRGPGSVTGRVAGC